MPYIVTQMIRMSIEICNFYDIITIVGDYMKDVNILKNNGVDVEKSLELLGDMEMYDEVMHDFLNMIDEKSVKNLQWLKALNQNEDITELRKENNLLFPIEKVVIVEGATEEILLPEFAKLCDFVFDQNGIFIIPAGGKNQVVKLYYELIEYLKLPIFVLLDKDAKENLEQINPKLRKTDKIHILKCGEFEDLLPLDLINRTLEYEISTISIIDKNMFDTQEPRTKILEEIFKTRGRLFVKCS